MASSSSNVDSAENLGRWRAMMSGSRQIAIDADPSVTSSVSGAVSTSSNGSGLGELLLVLIWRLSLIASFLGCSEPRTSALPGSSAELTNGIETGRQSANERNGTSPSLDRPGESLLTSAKLHQYREFGLTH